MGLIAAGNCDSMYTLVFVQDGNTIYVDWGENTVKIIIIGCGKVGQTLAVVLSEENNDVTVVDQQRSKMEVLCNQYNIIGVVGNGASYAVQKEAGVEQADLLIAVTGSDELNLLSCLIAKKAGNCNTIARVRKPEYNEQLDLIKEELGLAMVINQEWASAQEVSRVLKFPSAIKIDTFAKSRVEILKYRVPAGSILAGMTLEEMHSRLKCNILICAAERDGQVRIPKGDYEIQEKDVISIVATAGDANDFFKKIGVASAKVKNIIMVGGGEIAYYLAKMLLPLGIRVKIIEKNLSRCEELARLLPKATIINGDGTDKQLLLEEGIQDCDSFAALTDFDEENILISLYFKGLGKKKSITKINRIAFDEVVRELDLDTVFYPKNITAENIIRYVRAMKQSFGSNVETVHRLENNVEALEFVVDEKADFTDIELQKLSLKDTILLAYIGRKGEHIIPRGNDVLKTGDTVIVVTTKTGFHDISDIFQK